MKTTGVSVYPVPMPPVSGEDVWAKGKRITMPGPTALHIDSDQVLERPAAVAQSLSAGPGGGAVLKRPGRGRDRVRRFTHSPLDWRDSDSAQGLSDLVSDCSASAT